MRFASRPGLQLRRPVLRLPEGQLRRALRRGRDGAQDDVGRPALPPRRPAGADRRRSPASSTTSRATTASGSPAASTSPATGSPAIRRRDGPVRAPPPGKPSFERQPMTTTTIDGRTLTAADVLAVARPDAAGHRAEAVLDDGRANGLVGDARLHRRALHERRRAADVRVQHRRRPVQGPARAHGRDAGLPAARPSTPTPPASASRFAEDAVRATMLLRANAFASNYLRPARRASSTACSPS